MVSQLKVNEIIKQSGSSITIGETGDSITFPSTGTASGIFTTLPAFSARIGTEMSLSQNTYTTITADTEIFDSDSCYDTSTYTFTPNVAGKYYFFANIRMADNSAGTYAYVSFYKNGDTDVFELKHYVASHGSSQNNTELTLTPCRIIDMNGTTDNVLCRVQATSTGVEVKAGSAQTHWGAFRLIGV